MNNNPVEKGFTGISFPFRIGVKGGVVMSTTNIHDNTHIIEAITQILLTRPMERSMEYHFKSDIDYDIFEPNDISTHTLLEYQIKEALRILEDRIEVRKITITSEGENNEYIYADISFKVINTGIEQQTRIRIGGVE